MVTRITGLSSGMDIDSLVKQLMTAEKMPLDKMNQNKQTLTWKSDGYREINKQLASLNTAMNSLRFSSQWQTAKATSSNSGVATASVSSGATAGSHSLVVYSLASAAVLKGNSISAFGTGTTETLTAASASGATTITEGDNDQFNVTLNGVTKAIKLTAGEYTDSSALATELQNQLDGAFGSGRVAVGIDNEKISLSPQGTAGNLPQLTVGQSGSNNGLTELGFASVGQAINVPTLTASTPFQATTISDGVNDQFNVTLDGVTKVIKLSAGNYADSNALATELQKQLNSAFGYNRVIAGTGAKGDTITLTPQGSAGNLPQLTVGKYGSNKGLTALGFASSGQSFKVDINAKLSDTAGQFGTTPTYGTFKVNGVEFSYTANDSLASIMSKVNASTTAGVRMSYDSVTDQFTITSKTTGAASAVNVQDGTGNLASLLGFGSSQLAYGTDADVKIDGTSSKRSSNSFTVDGVTYSLVSADPEKTVTVNVTQDTDAIYNSIKNFVDAYNTTMTLLKTRMNETVDKNYPPLTDDQKKAMSTDDINLWEAKAKVGVLRNDSILSSISSSLRQLTSASLSSLPSDFNSLYKIGITTTSYSTAGYDVTTSSNLQIDESKLRAAIEKDPDSVIKLFSNQPGNGSAANTGIAQQMYTQINSSISQLVTKAGGLSSAQDAVTSTLGKQLHDLENQIDLFQDKLDTKENNYYKQFSAMETAVQKGNSTLSWLQSQFG